MNARPHAALQSNEEALAMIQREAANAAAEKAADQAVMAREEIASLSVLNNLGGGSYQPPIEISSPLPVGHEHEMSIVALAFRHLGYLPHGATMDAVGSLQDVLSMDRANIVARLARLTARPECREAITRTRLTGRAAEMLLAGALLSA